MNKLTNYANVERMICLHDPKKPQMCNIFGVSRDNAGFPCFLIHEEPNDPEHRGQWRFLSAKYFAPMTRDNLVKYGFGWAVP